jgi:hypothetical protein
MIIIIQKHGKDTVFRHAIPSPKRVKMQDRLHFPPFGGLTRIDGMDLKLPPRPQVKPLPHFELKMKIKYYVKNRRIQKKQYLCRYLNLTYKQYYHGN